MMICLVVPRRNINPQLKEKIAQDDPLWWTVGDGITCGHWWTCALGLPCLCDDDYILTMMTILMRMTIFVMVTIIIITRPE